MARSVTMLANTGTNFNITSDKIRADAYYGFTDGLHTVAFYLSNFTGRILLDATLEASPTSTDWFALNLDANTTVDYLDYTAETSVVGKTFQGNFLYLRIRVDRSHLTPANNSTLQWGAIAKVALNH